jgi:small subunit ribosomal protein S2
MLTNFNTIRGSIKKLKDIEKMREDGTLEKFTKKERGRIEARAARLQKILGGIKEMNHLPGLMIVIDARKEAIAVAEAKILGIPIIGIIDTNADPDPIDFPIAANDDAIKSIRVIMRDLIDSALEASGGGGQHSAVGQEMMNAAVSAEVAVATETQSPAPDEKKTTE